MISLYKTLSSGSSSLAPLLCPFYAPPHTFPVPVFCPPSYPILKQNFGLPYYFKIREPIPFVY